MHALAFAPLPAPIAVTHVLNWYGGWALLLTSFAVGALVGLSFHRETFLGGYASFPRRLIRRGHIALAALGMVNLIYALAPWPAAGTWAGAAAGPLFLAGGALMPLVCFLTAWKRPFRHAFALPVSILVAAVIVTLIGGGAP